MGILMRPTLTGPRLVALVLALAATLAASIATAQEPLPLQPGQSRATLFHPAGPARPEALAAEGTATWRLSEFAATPTIEALLAYPAVGATALVTISANTVDAFPDSILIDVWPQWPVVADGPTIVSAFAVGVETVDGRQVGFIASSRSGWTVGLLAAAAEFNNELLRTAPVLIVELFVSDGSKAYLAVTLGDEQRALLEQVIPPG